MNRRGRGRRGLECVEMQAGRRSRTTTSFVTVDNDQHRDTIVSQNCPASDRTPPPPRGSGWLRVQHQRGKAVFDWFSQFIYETLSVEMNRKHLDSAHPSGKNTRKSLWQKLAVSCCHHWRAEWCWFPQNNKGNDDESLMILFQNKSLM